MSNTILITGASGNIGSYLIEGLVSNESVNIRALVRDKKKAAVLAKTGASPVIGDFEDRLSLEAAMADVDTVVLITPASPDAAKQASAVARRMR